MRIAAIPNVPDLLRLLLRAALALWLVPIAAGAEGLRPDHVILHYSNDSNAAPSRDRWRTVAVAVDLLAAREGGGFALRLGAEVLAPVYLAAPGPDPDRPLAGVVSLIGSRHQRLGKWETEFGLGLSATGPQTGLDDLLDRAHSVLNGGRLGPAIISGQVGDGFYLETRTELAREVAFQGMRLRPFARLATGVETVARIGVDIEPEGAWSRRSPVTGALIATDGPAGWQMDGGFDLGYVMDTALIPDSVAGGPVPLRARARLGVAYQHELGRATFGLGWLSKEFAEQPEGQFIGTASLSLTF